MNLSDNTGRLKMVFEHSSYVTFLSYYAGFLLQYFIKASWAHAGTFGGCGLYLITFIFIVSYYRKLT